MTEDLKDKEKVEEEIVSEDQEMVSQSEEEASEEQASAEEKNASSEEDLLMKEARRCEELEAKLKDTQDRLLRSMAEFDNYRKRTTKEKTQSFDNGVKHIVENLLPVIDNLERALAAAKDPEDNFVKGVQMTYDLFISTLEKLNVKQINPLGETFDPHFHDAMQHVEDEEHGEDEVVQVFQKGYLIGDVLIRAALVKVAN